ncbi:hypothetical protein SAY86_029013 [Trapa natans]|uniref:SHSP domain-containing protein n=1 Tax=Trapa natans TaxID=22666 RepID=A0AAN7MDR8_TRANT|nr:hypothetical protein SAY86_029013 [Trapa natans]
MASSVALRRMVASVVSRVSSPTLIRSAAVAPAAVRSLNTNAQMKSYEEEYDRGDEVDRRHDRTVSRHREPSFFSDVFDPFSQTRSLSQVLNMMDQFMESPFLTSRSVRGGGSRRSWDVKEAEDALFLRMDMPGLGKEDVKVSVEQDTLIIKGEGEKESGEGDEASSRRYVSRLDLPQNLYKLEEIKAEMKNGVLKVVVPKVKEEEKKNVFQVNIE